MDNYHSLLIKIALLTSKKIVLVAASKTQPVEKIHVLYKLEHRDFGENYVQELVRKAIALKNLGCNDIRWHFIGHLQSNKINALLPWVHCIHSVDSLKLGENLSKSFEKISPQKKLPIFIQVNIDQAQTKFGVSSEETLGLLISLSKYKNLDILGLMCFPAPFKIQKDTSNPFQKLNQLEKTCQPYTKGYLSMGMSSDYELAIKEGATHIRIGEALFGKR
ncbi:MAG: YggS family pyridoxal phosphate-dependent enzyme [Deltaproteobacteria bacterium]|nr:YggS family pyridoxal phosphate-dependent enzyme [Deltaproteobacteria bacterium]